MNGTQNCNGDKDPIQDDHYVKAMVFGVLNCGVSEVQALALLLGFGTRGIRASLVKGPA